MRIKKTLCKTAFSFLCGLLTSFVVVHAQTPPSQDSQQRNAIRAALSQLIEKYNIPGASLTYGFDEQPLQTITVGYSDLATKQAMTKDNIFISGSVTKSFVGAAILKEIEQGKITKDETLSSIAKQYSGEISDSIRKYPQLGTVTLKQLLTHTSGIPKDINSLAFKKAFISNPYKSWTDQELLAIAMQKPFYFKPGSPGLTSYTNTDYLILGIVLKSISRQPISSLFKALWTEAQLKNIYYYENGIVPENVQQKMAVGYESTTNPDALLPAFQGLPQVNTLSNENEKMYALNNAYTIFLGSAGGIITNTTALANWYRELFQNEAVLSQQSIQDMLKSDITVGKDKNLRYGFGVVTYSSPQYGYFVSHDGFSPGYSMEVFYFYKYHLVLALAINDSNQTFMNTYDIDTGEIEPGAFMTLMPILVDPNYA